MSHASGIKVSEGLATAFASAQSNQTRCIKVGIVSESLQEQDSFPVSGSFEDDFTIVTKCLEPKKPSYVLYRLDSTTSSSEHEWLFLCYVPDDAAVRDKMLYASTRSSLLQSLGENRFVDSIFGTTMDEFTLQGYKKHLKAQKAAAPLTQREQELADIRLAEMSASQSGGINARRSLLDNANAPSPGLNKLAKLLSNDAMGKIKLLSQGQDANFNTVILYLDITTEIVEIKETLETTAETLSSHIPKDQPSFVFFAYPHSHKGEDHYSISKFKVMNTSFNRQSLFIAVHQSPKSGRE